MSSMIIEIVIWLGIAIVCAIIHKNKGYSIVTGFLWGFFFSVIGLAEVLLEKDKKEHDIEVANKKNSLSKTQWMLLIIGVIILLIIIIIIFSIIINLELANLQY